MADIINHIITTLTNDVEQIIPPIATGALLLGVVLLILQFRKTGKSLIVSALIGIVIFCSRNDIFSYVKSLFP